MKKQQKWELLKFAYDNYYKDVEFTWNDGITKIVSNGKFKIKEEVDDIINIAIENHKDKIDYIVFDGDKWAEIVTEKPKSTLDGKVAVEINNKRELKLFNESSKYKYNPAECYEYPLYMGHTEHGFSSNKYFYEKRNYTIISFEDFAKETGIEMPVFAIKSIDGVDLFFGDKIHRSWWDNFTNKWRYDNCTLNNDRNAVITGVDQAKSFSTKEAAEAWILEANKPSEIVLFEDQPVKVIVTKDGFISQCNEISHGFDAKELQEIYQSFKKIIS